MVMMILAGKKNMNRDFIHFAQKNSEIVASPLNLLVRIAFGRY